ncbi:unnamed protein product [Caenorhabditis bovis]|uniref:Domain of unknown function DX domain-containing protein n=1 Tax=Caenorhabditis bovis TaxID=2654633 RepID=A0A8S1FG07_9PELO|nr:unnamed protein product [Caenorhabditis bovis]
MCESVPATKPIVHCTEDMDCAHLIRYIPNAYCNYTGGFCCSGLLDVCFGGGLVRPLLRCDTGTMAGFETCHPDLGNGELRGFCTDIGVSSEGDNFVFGRHGLCTSDERNGRHWRVDSECLLQSNGGFLLFRLAGSLLWR